MSNAIRIDRLDKNYIINGGFDFFQRGGATAPISISTTPSYVAPDRFKVSYIGTVTGTPSVERVANTMSSPKAKYAIQFSGQRNASSFTSVMEQRVEGIEARELVVAGTAAFSIQVFSPISGATVQLTLSYPTVEDNYASTVQFYQQTSSTTITASTWTQIVFSSIAIPSNVTNGVSVVVDLIIPSGTDGSPQNYLMTQAHLNAGITTPVFVRHGRNIAGELLACQRFYQKTFPIDTTPAQNTGAWGLNGISITSGGAGLCNCIWFFKSEMRIPPNPTTFNPFSANTGLASAGSGNFPVSAYSTDTHQVTFLTNSTSPPAGAAINLNATADAEI